MKSSVSLCEAVAVSEIASARATAASASTSAAPHNGFLTWTLLSGWG